MPLEVDGEDLGDVEEADPPSGASALKVLVAQATPGTVEAVPAEGDMCRVTRDGQLSSGRRG